MKIFRWNQIREAVAYAVEDPDNTALHLHYFITPTAPACFKRDVGRRLPIAHLFGQDAKLLEAIARHAGVNKIVIERTNTPRQHIDLCGAPLRRVLEECGEDINNYRLEED